MVRRREKEKDLRYIQEASAPATVTVYQIYKIVATMKGRTVCIGYGVMTV
jgi:hypothetical protein